MGDIGPIVVLGDGETIVAKTRDEERLTGDLVNGREVTRGRPYAAVGCEREARQRNRLRLSPAVVSRWADQESHFLLGGRVVELETDILRARGGCRALGGDHRGRPRHDAVDESIGGDGCGPHEAGGNRRQRGLHHVREGGGSGHGDPTVFKEIRIRAGVLEDWSSVGRVDGRGVEGNSASIARCRWGRVGPARQRDEAEGTQYGCGHENSSTRWNVRHCAVTGGNERCRVVHQGEASGVKRVDWVAWATPR